MTVRLTPYVCPWCVRDFLLAVAGAPPHIEASCPHCGTPGLKTSRAPQRAAPPAPGPDVDAPFRSAEVPARDRAVPAPVARARSAAP